MAKILSHIETHAAESFRKPLTIAPLNDRERYHWIAFLITQWIRTPKFISRLGTGVKAVAEQIKWDVGSDSYRVHPEKLRLAHQHLFRDNGFFALRYRRLDSRRWTVLRTPKHWTLLRSDDASFWLSEPQGEQTLYYPLNPSQCVRIGPEKAGEKEPPIPLREALTDKQARLLNRMIASRAKRSVIAVTNDSESIWIERLNGILAASTPEHVHQYKSWGPGWETLSTLKRCDVG